MSSLFSKYQTWEHATFYLSEIEGLNESEVHSKKFGNRTDVFCYRKFADGTTAKMETSYFIGVDWLVEGRHAIVVAPKLDTRPPDFDARVKDGEIELDEGKEEASKVQQAIAVDYFAMLQQCLHTDYLYEEVDNLVQINWKAKEILIPQSQDWLSPLLIVKFLHVLKSIVRKGLKKGYYPITQNLNGKIKGKILIGQNIRQNIVKNRFAKTTCQYEEYSIDNAENRLLHKAFRFAASYLENFKAVYKGGSHYFTELVNYCRPAFEMVGTEIQVSEIKQFKPNPFFKEYSEGIHLAKLILKRYAYTISNTTLETVSTPPYWIDMPKLFELYVYQFLKAKFPAKDAVKYQFSTYGNALDFLVNDEVTNTKMVVDAKYKPSYMYSVTHLDIRQVSGYARLEKVYCSLKADRDEIIKCLIVYPDIFNGYDVDGFKNIALDNASFLVKAYRKVFKVGITLPIEK